MWHMPVLLSLLETANPAQQLLNILANLILEKSTVVVGSPPEADETLNNSQITLISSVANCLARLMQPISWAQTLIPILPAELIDVLDAPMPYLVGIRARELTNQSGIASESEFIEYLQGLDCIDEKCVIRITHEPRLHVYNFGDASEADPEEGRFLLLGEGQRANLFERLKSMIQWFQSTLKRQGSIYEPCFQATEQQQHICEQIMDFLQEQIFQQVLQPVEELGKIGMRLTQSQGPGKGVYTVDEIREFAVCQLAQQWTMTNQEEDFAKAKKFYTTVFSTQNMISLIDQRIGIKY